MKTKIKWYWEDVKLIIKVLFGAIYETRKTNKTAWIGTILIFIFLSIPFILTAIFAPMFFESRLVKI